MLISRFLLQTNWFFECLCERCCDPGDLGSGLDSWQCPACPGQLEPGGPGPAAAWVCGDGCGAGAGADTVSTWERTLQGELDKAGPDLFLERYTGEGGETVVTVEPAGARPGESHWLLVEARLSLVHGAGAGVAHCTALLLLLDRLELGLTPLRGILLYQAGLAVLARLNRELEAGSCSPAAYKAGMQSLAGELAECRACLAVEAEGTYNRLLGDRATALISHVRQHNLTLLARVGDVRVRGGRGPLASGHQC